jgi:hypothetical protein
MHPFDELIRFQQEILAGFRAVDGAIVANAGYKPAALSYRTLKPFDQVDFIHIPSWGRPSACGGLSGRPALDHT